MTNGSEAYRSEVTTCVEHLADLPADLSGYGTVVVGPLPSSVPAQRPGPVTDTTDPGLAALRRA